MNRRRSHVPFSGQTFVYLAVFLLFFIRFCTGDGLKQEKISQLEEVSALPAKKQEAVACKPLKQQAETRIRVRISDGKGSAAQKEVVIKPSCDYRVETVKKQYLLPAQTSFSFGKWMKENQISFCSLKPYEGSGTCSLLSVTKAQMHPVYPECLDIFYSEKEDGFYVINEVTLEAYLPGVVGSEMPCEFPLEAQKAQAVCARSFASCTAKETAKILSVYGFSDTSETVCWNLEDTVSDQVYIPGHETGKAQRGCEETEGVCLYQNDSIIKPHFYSTSWGEASDGSVFEQAGDQAVAAGAFSAVADCSAEFVKKLDGTVQELDYDRNSPWYRWKGWISLADIEIGAVKAIQVTKRGTGEAVTQILITDQDGSGRFVSGASQIRQVLGSEDTLYQLLDGRTREGLTILPSPFFAVEEVTRNQDGLIEAILLAGGGFGHGYGMSQYGASQMAEDGNDYQEILGYYFPGMELKKGKE